MFLGATTLGRFALGQIPNNNGIAQGAVLEVTVGIQNGTASVEQASTRVAGVPGFYTRKPEPLDVFAFGAIVEVGVGFTVGTVRAERIREVRLPEIVVQRPQAVTLLTLVPPDIVEIVALGASVTGEMHQMRATIDQGQASVDWSEFDQDILLLVA